VALHEGCRPVQCSVALLENGGERLEDVGNIRSDVEDDGNAGHCARRANPTDRRSSILELTSEGEALLERALPVFDGELRRLVQEPLSADAVKRLGEALGTLRRTAIASAATGIPSAR
jgi:hypothetical protein